MSAPFVSVVIGVRNSEDGIAALLACLRRQTLQPDRFEVIVGDDASSDRTAEVARANGATVVALERWGGSYAARNAALRRARGQVIAITDGDCRPRPEWLEAGLAELDALGADLVGGHIDVRLSERPSIAELVDFARYLDQRRSIEEAGFAVTANLFARRAVVDRIGMFNERVISGGDAEFSLRATEAGFALAYSERPVVDHEPRRAARSVARRAFRGGFGLAQMRRYGDGPFARGAPAIWRRPGAWLPGALLRRTGVYGVERIYAAGREPSRSELVRIALAEYAFIQLPLAAGNVAGALTTAVRGR
jgi:glycosyltransferase involved in cell wall biosynthesis